MSDSQYMNNTKLAMTLVSKHLPFCDNSFNLKVNSEVDKITLTADSDIEDPVINNYDVVIMDAIYTAVTNGITVLTTTDILRIMSGNPNLRPSGDRRTELEREIEKLSHLHIKVDCTDTYNKYHKTQKSQSMIYESPMLCLEYSTRNGRCPKYKNVSVPALYKYAETFKQIIRFDPILLKTQKLYNDNMESIIIKRYVIKRILLMQHYNRLNSNKIAYGWHDGSTNEDKGMMPRLGYELDNTPSGRKKKCKLHKTVTLTLTHLADCGIIESYKPYRDTLTGRKSSPIKGIEIELVNKEENEVKTSKNSRKKYKKYKKIRKKW